jgi:methanogenic corrinoid protein MtbC1
VEHSKDRAAARHPIGVVASRTGLPQDLIRAWERRYGAVTPARGRTDRRLYSDQDIDKLRMLRQAVSRGRRISDVARLPVAELEALVAEDRNASEAGSRVRARSRVSADSLLAEAMEALEALDRHRLENVLANAAVEMSGRSVRQDLVVPLLEVIGARWEEGSLRIVHEHLASTIVRTFMSASHNGHDRSNAPRIVITTPAGQNHELGALMAATVAEEAGWNVYYLGPNLPAEEIAAAVRQLNAKAVALSLIYKDTEAHVVDEMKRLRRLIDSSIPVFVGGRAAASIRGRLDEAGIKSPGDLQEFRAELQVISS